MSKFVKPRLHCRLSALAFSLAIGLERSPTIRKRKNGYTVGDRVGVGARRSASSAFSLAIASFGWLHCWRSVLAIAAVFRLLFTFNFLFRLKMNQSF